MTKRTARIDFTNNCYCVWSEDGNLIATYYKDGSSWVLDLGSEPLYRIKSEYDCMFAAVKRQPHGEPITEDDLIGTVDVLPECPKCSWCNGGATQVEFYTFQDVACPNCCGTGFDSTLPLSRAELRLV